MSRLIDLTGKTFGYWHVMGRALHNDHSGKPLWVCECELCHKEYNVAGKALRGGHSSSCRDCRNTYRFSGESHPHWKGYKDIPHAFWNSIITSARQRNIDFDISIQDAWKLLERQDFKCALTGLDISIKHIQSRRKQECTASLDRIDSSQGYLPNNVQWVHKTINRMKWDLNQSDFISFCSLVAEYNNVQTL